MVPSLKLTKHLKMDGLKTSFLLGRPVFRCELLVSGRVPRLKNPKPQDAPNHQAPFVDFTCWKNQWVGRCPKPGARHNGSSAARWPDLHFVKTPWLEISRGFTGHLEEQFSWWPFCDGENVTLLNGESWPSWPPPVGSSWVPNWLNHLVDTSSIFQHILGLGWLFLEGSFFLRGK